MQQPETGHSPNTDQSSSGNIEGVSTRRGLLGLLGLAPLAVALPALAKAVPPRKFDASVKFLWGVEEHPEMVRVVITKN